MRVFSNKVRPFPLGPFPMERLSRIGRARATDLAAGASLRRGAPAEEGNLLHAICADYRQVYEQFRAGAPAAERAPYTEDLMERANDLKGLGYFFDATLVGLCRIPESARGAALAIGETHAIVLLVEDSPIRERDNPVYGLIRGSRGAVARLRVTEIAVILALYLRRLGFAATAQTAGRWDINLDMLALEAGLARIAGKRLQAPFVGHRFALAAVTTEMVLPEDGALAPRRWLEGGLAWQTGIGGTETWWNRAHLRGRPADVGRYPMEKVKRVPETTTLILHDEVPRLPKRSNAFFRAALGDMGKKAQQEMGRFASKTPLAGATRVIIQAQQPHQIGKVAPVQAPGSQDSDRNRRAIKTLMIHLGADIVGTSEAKRYVWYSHELSGEPIEVAHPNAITMVIDQGFDTMEGASGDDWFSASQSMRAYMRGAQIVGVTAAWIRAQGYPAKAHTNIDSDVIQTPLVVLAGLGEMSRIGETVLNPFIGPRSKSAVVTTSMPVTWDQPIDFGLQDACAKCMKCARECPCDAITYGGTVMFNGYEQWKQDVHRCTAYRVTNQGGAGCGRCMKTCPYNNEGLLVHRVLLWAATKIPALRKPLADLDDRVGNGSINPVKRWWQDLEIVEGRVVKPARTNQRTLDLKKETLKAKQRISYTNANMLPAPDERGAVLMDRKAGTEAALKLETVAAALARHRAGGAKPNHYVPTELKSTDSGREKGTAHSAALMGYGQGAKPSQPEQANRAQTKDQA